MDRQIQLFLIGKHIIILAVNKIRNLLHTFIGSRILSPDHIQKIILSAIIPVPPEPASGQKISDG